MTKVPVIQLNASYWLCRAKLAEKEGGDQSALECLFEAVEFGAEVQYKQNNFFKWGLSGIST